MNLDKIHSKLLLLLIVLPLIIKCGEKPVDPALLPVMFVYIDSITTTSAVLVGHNNHSGGTGLYCTQLGFYWSSTSADPTEKDNKISMSPGSGYQFKANLTGLTPGTKYYVKSYAVNSYGAGKSMAAAFTTLTN
jgi:hypothetical protein